MQAGGARMRRRKHIVPSIPHHLCLSHCAGSFYARGIKRSQGLRLHRQRNCLPRSPSRRLMVHSIELRHLCIHQQNGQARHQKRRQDPLLCVREAAYGRYHAWCVVFERFHDQEGAGKVSGPSGGGPHHVRVPGRRRLHALSVPGFCLDFSGVRYCCKAWWRHPPCIPARSAFLRGEHGGKNAAHPHHRHRRHLPVPLRHSFGAYGGIRLASVCLVMGRVHRPTIGKTGELLGGRVCGGWVFVLQMNSRLLQPEVVSAR
mmetsp:Transcript_13438/g.31151  ORF Transcript_13438/g.31151 Transcript_13438/m.31151 type:complete len:259 (-) Transcript_13438:31-807(-)